MREKTISLLLVLSMVFSLGYGNVSAEASGETVTVIIMEDVLESDVEAYISDDDRTMVPVRAVSETLNASVTWDGVLEKVTIERGDTLIILTIDEAQYLVNGETMELDSPAVIVDDRTMVPLRFVAEALGESVEWDETTYTVTITPNGAPPTIISGLDEDGNALDNIEIYSFETLPVEIVRNEVESFILPSGQEHQYEVVYVAEKGINWVQAKALAEEAGGYLATITSKEENEFVFSLVEDEKYWFQWDDTHNYVMSGAFLGAYQAYGSEEPDVNWQWVTGEAFEYTNWAYDGAEGDDDPRPSDQPNDVNGNQNVICFGEINIPTSLWGDFPHKFGSYGEDAEGMAKAFIIEYGEY